MLNISSLSRAPTPRSEHSSLTPISHITRKSFHASKFSDSELDIYPYSFLSHSFVPCSREKRVVKVVVRTEMRPKDFTD